MPYNEIMPTQPTHKGEMLLHGARFDVRAVEVEGSDGRTHRREIVCHPGAVVVLPLIDANTVAMIRNFRPAVGDALWELPAGTLEPPEPPLDCAHRELLEEAGYEAGEMTPLFDFYTSPGICTERMFAFLAESLNHVGQQLEATEDIVVEPMAVNDVMEMIHSNRIRDGKTIATMLYYQAFRMGL